MKYVKQQITWTLVWLLTLYGAWAATPSTTGFIRVDQFGYLQNARKVAVIVDPQVGSNANTHFTPSTGANQYQVRRWADDAVVFAGTIQSWKEGVTQQTSGDKGWWFDFSTVNTPGSYYLFDVGNNVGSYRFEIGDNVYAEVLKAALRTFYYQRINFAKQTPYADPKWTDAATHEGPLQDRQATSRYAKGDLSTAKDLHGGWMDAGDMNKYVTFAEEPVGLLLESYRLNPSAFGDNLNIPESGNGLPDVLDEVKWELDWLRRMQDATGTGGLFLKVGVDNYNESNRNDGPPPSADRRPRYYLPECTASTLSGAAMFATAGAVYRTIPALQTYAADMTARAERAFARARTTTNGFTSFQTDCDDGDIRAGDADKPANIQKQSALIAAIYLFEATGKAEYKTYVENNYAQTDLMANQWWGPYGNHAHIALLRYAANPAATPSVSAAIRAMKSQQNGTLSVNDYTAKTDLYRAYMPDAQYHWGSSQVRANAGAANLDFVSFNVNSSNKALYRDVAASYLHWFHGVNAQGKVMLSNMYAYGAEDSQNEIYHVWFADGTPYDNALTSPKGPVPGYLTCGPQNLLYYTGTHTYLKSEPLQKRYKDWNGGFPENSWEITEVAIYNQAAYINLLSRLMVPTSDPTDTEPPTTPTNLVASDLSPYSVKLTWNGSVDNRAVTAYEIYQNGAKIAETPETSMNIETLSPATSYTFTVRAIDFSANRSGASNAVAVTTPAPSPNDLIIYGDAYRNLLQKWSWNATDNPDNANPVKMGQKSIKAHHPQHPLHSDATDHAPVLDFRHNEQNHWCVYKLRERQWAESVCLVPTHPKRVARGGDYDGATGQSGENQATHASVAGGRRESDLRGQPPARRVIRCYGEQRDDHKP
ncbi:MAG: glycoside hydrolase [Cytophagales bacterium]|nr:MAG: glycoside hydrolase [Cytophagales bacterium]